MAIVVAWPVPGPRIATMGVWPIPWAPHLRRGGVGEHLDSHGRRGGVAGPLGLVWPAWGRGRSPGPGMAAVGAWPVPWAQDGRRGGLAGLLGPV